MWLLYTRPTDQNLRARIYLPQALHDRGSVWMLAAKLGLGRPGGGNRKADAECWHT